MNIFTVPQQYIVYFSSDKCTYCKSVWIIASAEFSQCKCAIVCLLHFVYKEFHEQEIGSCIAHNKYVQKHRMI